MSRQYRCSHFQRCKKKRPECSKVASRTNFAAGSSRGLAAYVKRRRHETRGLRREERVVLKGGSAPRSVDEDPSARRIAAVAAAWGPVVCRLSSDIDRTKPVTRL
ncbi:hypothetical protein WN48_11052 [Eufriesea mexicana]|nr:hypothetical protein WN48_11052 [Eufriesea mexicana]